MKPTIVYVEFENINKADYPDFVDAFISYAENSEGEKLSDLELEELNNDRDLVYNLLIDYLY